MLQPDQLQQYEDMFALIARQLRQESGVDGEEAAHDWDALLSKIDQACAALQDVALPHFEKDSAASAIARTEG